MHANLPKIDFIFSFQWIFFCSKYKPEVRLTWDFANSLFHCTEEQWTYLSTGWNREQTWVSFRRPNAYHSVICSIISEMLTYFRKSSLKTVGNKMYHTTYCASIIIITGKLAICILYCKTSLIRNSLSMSKWLIIETDLLGSRTHVIINKTPSIKKWIYSWAIQWC